MAKVLIIQDQMKQYRVPFFTKLHKALQNDDIQLEVAYSPSPSCEAGKKDNCDLPNELSVRVPRIRLGNSRASYQPLVSRIADASVVIVEQSTRHLLNYPLLLASRCHLKKVAFWGHGRYLRAEGSLSERVKRNTLGWVDWWFAYTNGVARYLMQEGYPPARITTVQNSIDLEEFRRCLSNISSYDVDAMREGLNIPINAPVGLYCGGLYPDKQLEFLTMSAATVQRAVPDFQLVVLGGGSAADTIRKSQATYPWIHYMGPQFGNEKAIYFRMASVFLMPASIGLAVLDAFAQGLPVLTTRMPFHGPEIDYVEDGINGVIAEPDVQKYADAVIRVISKVELLQKLKQGAVESGRRYSVENMIVNFRAGIKECLSQGPMSSHHIFKPRRVRANS